jgi:hypothetical protein
MKHVDDRVRDVRFAQKPSCLGHHGGFAHSDWISEGKNGHVAALLSFRCSTRTWLKPLDDP